MSISTNTRISNDIIYEYIYIYNSLLKFRCTKRPGRIRTLPRCTKAVTCFPMTRGRCIPPKIATDRNNRCGCAWSRTLWTLWQCQSVLVVIVDFSVPVTSARWFECWAPVQNSNQPATRELDHVSLRMPTTQGQPHFFLPQEKANELLQVAEEQPPGFSSCVAARAFNWSQFQVDEDPWWEERPETMWLIPWHGQELHSTPSIRIHM